MIKKIISILTIVIAMAIPAKAQQNASRGSGNTTVQPRIMVVPFTKEGEDIRTIIEDDSDIRIILTTVKEYFDERGFTTVDFAARLKSMNTSNILTTADGATKDIKAQIIASSGADMYVEVEVIKLKDDKVGNSAKIILTAYETSTGNSLANKVGDSGAWKTEDYSKIAKAAMNKIGDDFMVVMQDKFTDIVKNGRSVQLEFAIAEGSDITMHSEVGLDGYALADAIELWLAENAYNGYYHIQGVTDMGLIVDEVKIPLRDQRNGANYTVTRFGAEINKFMRSINVSVKRTVQNQKLIFVIE